jgi:NAD-dependent dihydropyrimidine dehydrogenase PreA subunit
MMYYIDKNLCTGCAVCINSCPEKAISIINEKASIDSNKCTLCGKCVQACPLGAIKSDFAIKKDIRDQQHVISDSGFGKERDMKLDIGRVLRIGISKILGLGISWSLGRGVIKGHGRRGGGRGGGRGIGRGGGRGHR